MTTLSEIRVEFEGEGTGTGAFALDQVEAFAREMEEVVAAAAIEAMS